MTTLADILIPLCGSISNERAQKIREACDAFEERIEALERANENTVEGTTPQTGAVPHSQSGGGSGVVQGPAGSARIDDAGATQGTPSPASPASVPSVEEMAERLYLEHTVECEIQYEWPSLSSEDADYWMSLARAALSALPAPDAPKPASEAHGERISKFLGALEKRLDVDDDDAWMLSRSDLDYLRACLSRAPVVAQGEPPTIEVLRIAVEGAMPNGPLSINDVYRAIEITRTLCLSRAPSPSPCVACASKDEFIAALQKRIDSLLSGTVESFVDGVLTIRPHKEIVAVMANALAGVLDEVEAPNYVEMELKRAGSTKAYRVTIQRPDGKSAHELRMEAERKLAELKPSPSPALAALVEAGDAMRAHLGKRGCSLGCERCRPDCRNEIEDDAERAAYVAERNARKCSCGAVEARANWDRARAALPKGGGA